MMHYRDVINALPVGRDRCRGRALWRSKVSNRDMGKDVADKYSLRGRVFHQIRDGILSGKYKDREELREVAIGEELGVSRTPVREAFRQLELEGLIQIIPNKGAYVTGITVEDVHDIYAIRARLEGLAARWACEHITGEQLEEMEEIIYLSKFHAAKEHHEQLAELDNQFHDVLYRACHSKLLEHQLRDLHQFVIRIRRMTLSNKRRGEASNLEHERLLEAIRSNNPDLAEQVASQHMINAYENIKNNGLDRIYSEKKA